MKKIGKEKILLHPQNSRVLWHDLKKYLTIFNLCLDNINHEIFGKIPDNFQEPINDLNIVSTQANLYTQNIALLSRIELKSLKFDHQEADLDKAIEKSLKFLSFIFKANSLVVKPTLSDLKIAKIDQRYFELFITNIIYIISQFYLENENQKIINIETNSKSRKLVIWGDSPSFEKKPKDYFDQKNLTDENLTEPFNKVALHLVLINHLAQSFTKKIDFNLSKHKVLFKITF